MEGGVLVADIGGSSSRWAWLGPDQVVHLTEGQAWPGANIATGDAQSLLHRLGGTISEWPPVKQVLMYAAGAGSPQRAVRLQSLLSPLWPGALIVIEDDLLGAARSVWGEEAGHVLILGTGLNAGYYDGNRISQRLPSLGWILGDEGSGADLGKHLLRDALMGRMPPAIRATLFGPEGPDREEILRELHRGEAPAAYAARGVARLAALRSDPYVQALLQGRFAMLAHLLSEPPLAAGAIYRAVGSVAFGFQQELRSALRSFGTTLDAVVPDPLEGLIAYHRRPAPPAAPHRSGAAG